MLDAQKIHALVAKCVVELRKGEEVEEEILTNGVKVTHVFMMDHESTVSDEEFEKYDMVFHIIGVSKKEAPQYKQEFISLIDPDLDQIREGLSYITWGALGVSQGLAMIIIALGKFYGLWEIITPMNMGFVDPKMIRDLAGGGLIYNMGFKNG